MREVHSLLTSIAAPQRPRYLDQFLQLRNVTLDAAESDEVVDALQKAWDMHSAKQSKLAAELLLMELLAFPGGTRREGVLTDARLTRRGLSGFIARHRHINAS